jgi:hypothetical protein
MSVFLDECISVSRPPRPQRRMPRAGSASVIGRWAAGALLIAAGIASAGRQFEDLRVRPDGELPKVTPLTNTQTREAWELYRPKLREQWQAILGPFPPRVPLEVETLSTEKLDDHTRILLRYNVDDRTRVEAYLLIPPNASGDLKAPGMVCLHPTNAATIRTAVGLEGRESVHYALHVVRRGYVCIAPRNYLWEVPGESYQQAADRVRRDGRWKTGMARMIWDAIRATDVLAERPEIDPKRLGTIGHSLGGKEALYHAAFDDRIVAAISCEGGVGLPMGNWDAAWYLGDQIKSPDFHHDNQELMSLIAPRAILIIGGESADGAKSWPYVEACLPVWRLYDAEDRVGLLRHNDKHDFPHPGPRRDLVWQWLDAQMKP